jgi:hypothetical protein
MSLLGVVKVSRTPEKTTKDIYKPGHLRKIFEQLGYQKGKLSPWEGYTE